MVAIPLPLGQFQPVDINGAPYGLGTVELYELGGFTPKDSWQDYTQAVLNENPVPLDIAGRATIFGNGRYRQILKDKNGNTIWDKEVDALVLTGADTILTFAGGPPGHGQWLGGEIFTRTVGFDANFAGSRGLIPKTLPTASFAVSILKNGGAAGTATCSTGGTWAFLSAAGAAITFNDGDYLDFFGPGVADATVADFGLTLKGTFAP